MVNERKIYNTRESGLQYGLRQAEQLALWGAGVIKNNFRAVWIYVLNRRGLMSNHAKIQVSLSASLLDLREQILDRCTEE